jgi:hypothetical protein
MGRKAVVVCRAPVEVRAIFRKPQGAQPPNLRPPFERISDPQSPLTRPEQMEQLSIFGLPNDYLITERATAL